MYSIPPLSLGSLVPSLYAEAKKAKYKRKVEKFAKEIGTAFHPNVDLKEVKYFYWASNEKLIELFNERKEKLSEILEIVSSKDEKEYKKAIGFLDNLALKEAEKIELKPNTIASFVGYCKNIGLNIKPIREELIRREKEVIRKEKEIVNAIGCPIITSENIFTEYKKPSKASLDSWIEQKELPSLEKIKVAGKRSAEECYNTINDIREALFFNWDMNKFTRQDKPYLEQLKQELTNLLSLGEKNLKYNPKNVNIWINIIDETINNIELDIIDKKPETKEIIPIKLTPQERAVKKEIKKQVKEEPEEEKQAILQ